MKRFVAFLVFTLFAVGGHGQKTDPSEPDFEFPPKPAGSKPCLAKQLNLRGLKLGDSKATVEKAVGGPHPLLGDRILETTTLEFKDLSSVYPFYLDNKVYALHFNYKEQENDKWKDVKDFAFFVSTSYNVPKENWIFQDSQAFLECDGLMVRANIGGLVSVAVTDVAKLVASSNQQIKDVVSLPDPTTLDPFFEDKSSVAKACDPSNINFRGIKLGDTVEAVRKAVVPERSQVKDFIGDLMYSPTSPKFRDIEYMMPRYRDRRLFSLAISYKKDLSDSPKDIDGHTNALSANWKIDTKNWDILRFEKGGNAVATCRNIKLYASFDTRPYLSFGDEEIDKIVQAEWEKKGTENSTTKP